MNTLKISDENAVIKVSQIMKKAFKNNKVVYCCGNGGLASTCDHFSAELNKSFISKRDVKRDLNIENEWVNKLEYGYQLHSLCCNNALLTAIVNDIGPEYVFAQQIYNFGKPQDVLIAMSTSGKSMNILYAIELANRIGMEVIYITAPDQKLNNKEINIVLEQPQVSIKQEEIIKFMHKVCYEFENEKRENV